MECVKRLWHRLWKKALWLAGPERQLLALRVFGFFADSDDC